MMMLLPPIRLLVIISMVACQPQFRKHWKRAPVHGTFNVDAYAYNKPQVNLVKHLPAATTTPGEMLPMGQLLQHLSHSSRVLPQSRNLDQEDSKPRADYQGGSTSGEPALKANALAALNSQLAQLQMNLSSTHASLYSHEFHVQNMGNRKIVLYNTLQKQQQQQQQMKEELEMEKKHRKSIRTEITSKQEQPLNVKLVLPELHESEEEQQLEQQVQEPITTAIRETTEAISTTEAEPSNKRQKYVAAEQLTVDIAKRVKDVSNSTTIERETPGGELKLKKTIVNAKQQQQQQQEMQNQHQMQQMREKLGMDSPVDRPNDNDAQANGLRASHPVMVEAVDKPPRLKSKRKQTKTRATKTQTKTPNEIDTKLTATTTTAAPPSVDMLMMSGPTDVSTRPHPQQPGNDIRSKGKGKGKRKGAVGQEQEIETTTNWWQILPYAEIRKFLNTIYDSITDEDSDDERATTSQRI